MWSFTRKDFLRLSASTAAASAVGLGNATAVQAAQAGAAAPRRTLIKGADILTMDESLGELTATDVLVENGRIAAIGPNLSAGDAVVIEASGMILMPGMADGHRHVWEGVEAGRLVKTEPARYGTYQSWKMKWMPSATAEDHHLAGYIGGLQAIDSGVTAILDYAHGQQTPDRAVAAARGLQESGISGWYAAQVGHNINYGPGDTLSLAEADAARGAFADDAAWETVVRVQEDVLSDTDAPLQMGVAFSNGSMGQPLEVLKEREWDRARSMGIQLFAHHSHRPTRPIPAGHFGHRDSGIRDLYEAGLLGPEYHLSHGTLLTEDELAIMRDTGVMLCSTVMGEFPYRAAGRGVASHWRARRAGVAVGIGVDVSIALTQDYFEHIRAAFWSMYQSDEGAEVAGSYTSEDTLDYATRLGARALRLGDVAGSVAVGKRADLVLLSTDRFNFPVIGSLADRVLNFATLPDIDSVWVGGRLLKHQGQMIGVDWSALKRRMIEMQTRIGRDMDSITFT